MGVACTVRSRSDFTSRSLAAAIVLKSVSSSSWAMNSAWTVGELSFCVSLQNSITFSRSLELVSNQNGWVLCSSTILLTFIDRKAASFGTIKILPSTERSLTSFESASSLDSTDRRACLLTVLPGARSRAIAVVYTPVSKSFNGAPI